MTVWVWASSLGALWLLRRLGCHRLKLNPYGAAGQGPPNILHLNSIFEWSPRKADWKWQSLLNVLPAMILLFCHQQECCVHTWIYSYQARDYWPAVKNPTSGIHKFETWLLYLNCVWALESYFSSLNLFLCWWHMDKGTHFMVNHFMVFSFYGLMKRKFIQILEYMFIRANKNISCNCNLNWIWSGFGENLTIIALAGMNWFYVLKWRWVHFCTH